MAEYDEFGSSSADTTAESAKAKDNGANADTPGNGQQALAPDGRINNQSDYSTSGTNANQPDTDTQDTGTNDPTVTTESSQATGNNSQQVPEPSLQGPTGANDAGVSNNQQAGVGAPPDDQRGGNDGTSNQTKNAINDLFGGPGNGIAAQDNVLDRFASYTYNIGWYLMSKEAFKNIDSGKTTPGGYYLLAQSGGAPANTRGVKPQTQQYYETDGTSSTGPAITDEISGFGRNPYFELDYYIDNVEIEQAFPGAGTGSSTGGTEVKFTVTEPYGITLLDNLFKAVNGVYKSTGIVGVENGPNYASAQYALIIRFYGYDENGVPVQVGRKNGINNTAYVEKFIPFVIANIEFGIANKLVEYRVVGMVVSDSVGKGSARGTIPSGVTPSGKTVRDVLMGSAAPDNATNTKKNNTRPKNPTTSNPPPSNNDNLGTVQKSDGTSDHYDEQGNFIGTW